MFDFFKINQFLVSYFFKNKYSFYNLFNYLKCISYIMDKQVFFYFFGRIIKYQYFYIAIFKSKTILFYYFIRILSYYSYYVFPFIIIQSSYLRIKICHFQ